MFGKNIVQECGDVERGCRLSARNEGGRGGGLWLTGVIVLQILDDDLYHIPPVNFDQILPCDRRGDSTGSAAIFVDLHSQ